MKITLYTITDCQFSKQEKEYLQSKGLQFEEKNLETNKDYLTEMLAVSNNFAGTPVTKIEKDDGSIVVLKGFTKEEFEKELTETAIAAAVATPPAVVQTAEPSKSADLAANDITNAPTPTATPQAPTPPQPAVSDLPSAPQIEETPPVSTPAVPQMPTVPPIPVEPTPPPAPAVSPVEPEKPTQDNQLNSILNDLQSMASKPSESEGKPPEPTPFSQQPTTTPVSSSPPSVPNPTF